MHNRKPTYVQQEVYQHLRDLSRFYQNMNEGLVRAKNRLHKVLQVTFPELEKLISAPTGEQYWNLVMAFPCKEFVLSLFKVTCVRLSVNLPPNSSLKSVLLT